MIITKSDPDHDHEEPNCCVECTHIKRVLVLVSNLCLINHCVCPSCLPTLPKLTLLLLISNISPMLPTNG